MFLPCLSADRLCGDYKMSWQLYLTFSAAHETVKFFFSLPLFEGFPLVFFPCLWSGLDIIMVVHV